MEELMVSIVTVVSNINILFATWVTLQETYSST